MHRVNDQIFFSKSYQYESAMLPMGWGMEGYMELNPDWKGSLEAMDAAADTEDVGVEAGPGLSMSPGVWVPAAGSGPCLGRHPWTFGVLRRRLFSSMMVVESGSKRRTVLASCSGKGRPRKVGL